MIKRELVSVGLVISVVLLAGFTFWFYLEGSASKRLLDKLALIKPGIKLADINEQLGGSTMHEFDKLDDIMSWGPVKDKEFCKDKKLYKFSDVVTPTCRGIKVYTDANNVIVYATWYQE